MTDKDAYLSFTLLEYVEALDLVVQLFAQTQAPVGTPSLLEGVSQKLGVGEEGTGVQCSRGLCDLEQ